MSRARRLYCFKLNSFPTSFRQKLGQQKKKNSRATYYAQWKSGFKCAQKQCAWGP